MSPNKRALSFYLHFAKITSRIIETNNKKEKGNHGRNEDETVYEIYERYRC